MAKKMWVLDPQSGGQKIPDATKKLISRRILDHAAENYAGKYNRIEVRFRGQFCYIDAYTEPYVAADYDPTLFGESREAYIERLRHMPTHLCRLRYFDDENQWSMAFYTYSHEEYEPCVFNNGSWYGTPEEAFDTSAVYLTE
ncbi:MULTISPECIES: hypothetical protein [unclassified Thiocapsa]|uniref:hypothetical protein n=1 Tax=unclassified Thiocapsa TaxID=2641286 RepID=UPI0035B086B1